jgi:hypothetical protein
MIRTTNNKQLTVSLFWFLCSENVNKNATDALMNFILMKKSLWKLTPQRIEEVYNVLSFTIKKNLNQLEKHLKQQSKVHLFIFFTHTLSFFLFYSLSLDITIWHFMSSIIINLSFNSKTQFRSVLFLFLLLLLLLLLLLHLFISISLFICLRHNNKIHFSFVFSLMSSKLRHVSVNSFKI